MSLHPPLSFHTWRTQQPLAEGNSTRSSLSFSSSLKSPADTECSCLCKSISVDVCLKRREMRAFENKQLRECIDLHSSFQAPATAHGGKTPALLVWSLSKQAAETPAPEPNCRLNNETLIQSHDSYWSRWGMAGKGLEEREELYAWFLGRWRNSKRTERKNKHESWCLEE